MLKKESKIRVLENFKSIDYIIFGKPINEVEVCCSFLKEDFISTKGALLSVIVDMYKLMNHNPSSVKEKITEQIITENAKKSANIAIENSKAIIRSEKGKKSILKVVSESVKHNPKHNVSEIVQMEIKKKAFSLAIDNLLIGRAIRESKDYKNLDKWDGKILEEAYKTLKESLIESSLSILEA